MVFKGNPTYPHTRMREASAQYITSKSVTRDDYLPAIFSIEGGCSKKFHKIKISISEVEKNQRSDRICQGLGGGGSSWGEQTRINVINFFFPRRYLENEAPYLDEFGPNRLAISKLRTDQTLHPIDDWSGVILESFQITRFPKNEIKSRTSRRILMKISLSEYFWSLIIFQS